MPVCREAAGPTFDLLSERHFAPAEHPRSLRVSNAR